jgi:hypothetical protein
MDSDDPVERKASDSESQAAPLKEPEPEVTLRPQDQDTPNLVPDVVQDEAASANRAESGATPSDKSSKPVH